MKKEVRYILTALILLLSVMVSSCTTEQPHGMKGNASRVDALFAEFDKPDSPGCALAIIKDGITVYERGYGMADLEHDVPITPETVFYIGSESKQFVAMCLLLLEEEGELSLDDDIRKYVPEIPDYGRPITIRHLILHTSGLRDYFTLWSLSAVDFANFIPESEVVALIARQKALNFIPGDERLYSNSGYLLLSVIVERVSGKPLSDYANENIFKSLGMENTHFHDNPSRLIPNRAFGHMKNGSGWDILLFRFALVGSGGLYTNVRDLAKWDANFYDNRLGTGGQALIDRMLTPGTLNSGEKLNYACALTVGEYRGIGTVRHGGALGGYRSHVLRFPDERFTVILLFNIGDVNPGDYAEKVADICLADRLGPAPEAGERGQSLSGTVEEGKQLSLSERERLQYAGDYDSDELKVGYRIFVEDGKLFARVRDSITLSLKPVENDVFDAGFAVMRFSRNARGALDGFSLDAGRVTNLKFSKM